MKFELRQPSFFPDGTEVQVFPASNWPPSLTQPEGEPLGASIEGEEVVDGVATFTLLEVGVRYWAAAEVDGQWRYSRIYTPAPTHATGSVEASHVVGEAGEAPFSAKKVAGEQFVFDESELQNGWVGDEIAYQGTVDGQVVIDIPKALHVGASAATIFTLPEEYWPPEKVVREKITIEVDGQVKPTVAAVELKEVNEEEIPSAFVPPEIAWEVKEGANVAYYKDRDVVRVEGVVHDTHDTLGEEDPVFVLPEGYRPSRRVFSGPDKWVEPDGSVFSREAGEGLATFLLDGLSFRAAE